MGADKMNFANPSTLLDISITLKKASRVCKEKQKLKYDWEKGPCRGFMTLQDYQAHKIVDYLNEILKEM